MRPWPSFNPPSASSAEGTHPDRHHDRGRGFNPPSASSAEGTRLRPRNPVAAAVSTHPPPHRRREPDRPGRSPRHFGFNPPSASSAEGTRVKPRSASRPEFQPTLRLIGGGNTSVRLGSCLQSVFQPTLRLIGGGNRRPGSSTPNGSAFQPTLRLIGGGNLGPRLGRVQRARFNPPSASSAEGTNFIRKYMWITRVSTHPPPHRRRERLAFVRRSDAWKVSTHPPPHRRREPLLAACPKLATWFQPTLRLIGGGNPNG